MIKLEDIITALVKFDHGNESIGEVVLGRCSTDVDGIIFLKPELTAIPPDKLHLALIHFESLLRQYEVKIQGTYIISGQFILYKNIFSENYKHIQQYTYYELTRNEISHAKLAKTMREHKDCEAALGGVTLVQRGFTPEFVLDLWSNSGKVIKIDDDLYGVPCLLKGQKILLLNGFYPAQLDQYNVPNSKIILFPFRTKTSFVLLKKCFQGSAEPDNRYPQSMRQHLYDKRYDYQLNSLSPSRNGIHLSNDREEGRREAKLFLDAIESYFEKGTVQNGNLRYRGCSWMF